MGLGHDVFVMRSAVSAADRVGAAVVAALAVGVAVVLRTVARAKRECAADHTHIVQPAAVHAAANDWLAQVRLIRHFYFFSIDGQI